MNLVSKKDKRFILGLCMLVGLMCSTKLIVSHAFLAMSLAVPGLGAGLAGGLFGSVGIFWSSVAGVVSLPAGIIVSA